MGVFNDQEVVRYHGVNGAIVVGPGGILGAGGAVAVPGGSLQIGASGTSLALISINGPSGLNRYISAQTNGSLRWDIVFANNTAETGADAGSNLSFSARTDVGAFIDTPFTIARVAGGVIVLGGVGRPITLALTNQGLRLNGQVDGAGVGAGTLLNAPAAGNPTKWMPINDAGVVRFFPCW